jgi:hypothetical protein
MYFTDGGHGDDLEVETIRNPAVPNGDKDYLIFPYGAKSFANATKEMYVRIPWEKGKPMSAAQAKAFQLFNHPDKDPRPVTAWMQGSYGPVDGYYWRSYGTPHTAAGSTDVPAITPHLEMIFDGQLVADVSLAALARDDAGKPLRGKLEPAGIGSTLIRGWPHLILGFATGDVGDYRYATYSYPIILPGGELLITDRDREVFVPMVDYGSGDRIGVSTSDGSPTRSERVEVISASCDSRNAGTYLITVGDWLDDRDARIDKLLAKYSGAS